MRHLIYGMLALGLLTVGYWSGKQHMFVAQPVVAQEDCLVFPQTGKTVCGAFLIYWRAHGGLAQQGYPISDMFQETSTVDGKIYDVQYFERAVFERHPENAGTPHEILLSLLGREKYEQEYPAGPPSGEVPLRSGTTLILAGTVPNTTFKVDIVGFVERTEFPATAECAATSAGATFVAVLLDVQNVAAQPARIRVPRLRDDGGRMYFEVDDTCPSMAAEHALRRRSSVAEVQPSAQEAIVIVYDVSVPHVGDFTLVPAGR